MSKETLDDLLNEIIHPKLKSSYEWLKYPCEHCTGTVCFEWFRFELVRCNWGCGEYHINYIKNHLVHKIVTFKDFI